MMASSKRSLEYTCSSHVVLSFLTHLQRKLFLLDDRSDFTMHRALLWSEIVDSIFSFLRAEDRTAYESAPAIMAALARTCRAFSEPALDIIWEYASPWNLALCMDAEIWNIRETTSPRARTGIPRTTWTLFLAISIERALERGLGTRFVLYAKRLRTYSVHQTYEVRWNLDGAIDEGVLASWARMSHLFPRVRKLSLHKDALCLHQEPAMFASFLAPGRLLSLEVRLIPGTAVHPDVTAALRVAGTSIQKLNVRAFGIVAEEWTEQTNAILSSATKLRVVDAKMPLEYTHLSYLVQNPHLTRLELNCSMSGRKPHVMTSLPKGSFALQELVVVNDKTPTAWVIRSLLDACASPSLIVCRFNMSLNPSLEAHDFLNIFQSLEAHIYLRRLTIDGPEDLHGDLTISHIFPILKGLRNLEELELPSDIVPDLPMAMLLELLHSCPRLESWRLSSNELLLAESLCSLSFTAFVALIESHPHIQRLPVIVSMEDRLPPEQGFALPSLYNDCLDVRDVQNMEETKQLVHEFFPRVDCLLVWSDGSTEEVLLFEN